MDGGGKKAAVSLPGPWALEKLLLRWCCPLQGVQCLHALLSVLLFLTRLS